MTLKGSDDNFIPVPNGDIVLRVEFDDWAILFNPDTADAFGINPTGVSTWNLIDGKRNIRQIIDAIHDEFDAVNDSVDSEITHFIEQLLQHGFIADSQISRTER